MMREKNPRFRDGFWTSPDNHYPRAFTAKLKNRVRDRENRRCFICLEGHADGTALAVHHVDYDKAHNRMRNLVAVCRACHGGLHGTESQRRRWAAKLSRALSLIFGYPRRCTTST
jgi:nitrate/TMAO reductase-like tetraheme cytochrome c subunit